MGWQDAPIVGNSTTPKNAWESAPIVKNADTTHISNPKEAVVEEAPEWAGKHPNLYGAYGVASIAGKSISNIPQSVAAFGKNITTPILHPIETAKGIGNLFIGTIEKIIPGVQDKEKYADALGNFLVERYGGLDNVRKTIEEDPVGVMADASMFLTGGGAAATKVGQVSKLATLEKVGAAASKIGKAVEPVNVASKLASPVIKAGSEFVEQTLGVTTGTGKGAIDQALKGSKDFREGITGKLSQEDMLNTTKDALTVVRDNRAKDYTSKLQNIKNIDTALDISPIKNKLTEKLKDFNIKLNSEGALDFSRSTLDRKAYNDIQSVYDKVMSWGEQAGDTTPAGLDILKRTLDDFYTESNNSRAFVTSLKNEVKNTLIKNVPEYGDMVKNYETTSVFLKEFDRALSTGKQAMADTAIRKLMSTQREGFEFRKTLLESIEGATGKDIQGMVAGISMHQITPKGLIGKLGVGAEIGLAISTGSPKIAAALLMASPRAVGEFLYWVGKGKTGADAVSQLLGVNVRNALQQIGRAKNVSDPFGINEVNHEPTKD